MNIEYAQTIPLSAILNKMGLHPIQQTEQLIIYPSPFGSGSDAGLHISVSDNSWYDTGTQTGGGSVELVCAWLELQQKKCSIKDALDWLKADIGYPSLLKDIDLSGETPDSRPYSLRYKTLLLDLSLTRYLLQLDIDPKAARKFLKQGYVLNEANGKEFLALCFKNEDRGYAIYNPHIVAQIGPSAISFIRGRKGKRQGVHVFTTIFDYLTVIAQSNFTPPDDDSIILNEYANLDNAAAYVRGYGYSKLYSWMDTSDTGKAVTAAFGWLCSTEDNLFHQVMQQPSATS